MVERGVTCNLTKSVLMAPMLIEEDDKVKTVIDSIHDKEADLQ